jgi:hypothetical protein
MRKIGLLVWPLAALIGAISIVMTAPNHTSSPLVQSGTSTSLLPS